jgi:hypothetical protein
MATPMLDPNHLRKVHVGEIKMNLPIPSLDESEIVESRTNSIMRKKAQKVVKRALKDIDLKELYEELVEKTDNMTPLTEDEFKQVKNQWVFVRVLQGDYLYLMFKADDKVNFRASNPDTHALLFFVEVRPMPKIIDGKLTPSRNIDWSWESFKFLSYEDEYEDIISWSNVYLVKSNNMNLFMNWKRNPFIK